MENFKFLKCKIGLRNGVFIPRPETEFWVKKAIKEIKNSKFKNQNGNSKLKILDIFSGSGCIGISVLKRIGNSFVDFIDIDKKAIEQIKINLKLNEVSPKRYSICQSNLFEKLKNRKYDYIFANPPYVALEKIKEVELEVLKYEPRKALLAGKKGLFYIKRFLKEAQNFLAENGVIFMEFSPEQKEDIREMLAKEGYKNFKFFQDQFFKYRFLKCF